VTDEERTARVWDEVRALAGAYEMQPSALEPQPG
jgi:hypothetical protein